MDFPADIKAGHDTVRHQSSEDAQGDSPPEARLGVFVISPGAWRAGPPELKLAKVHGAEGRFIAAPPHDGCPSDAMPLFVKPILCSPIPLSWIYINASDSSAGRWPKKSPIDFKHRRNPLCEVDLRLQIAAAIHP